MQSLAAHLPGHGWTAINLLEQEQPIHRDGNMLTGETGQYFMPQFGHFQSVCGQTMARWIFPDVEGEFQNYFFSVQSLLWAICNLGCIRKCIHTYISINHVKCARALHAHLLILLIQFFQFRWLSVSKLWNFVYTICPAYFPL
jgi:hypothetical protein